MLRSFTVIDPHLVNLIRENPRYTKLMPEEILGKFVSGRMMVKEARYVDDASSNVSRPHSKDARSTPTRIKQRESAPASNVVRLITS
jgi:hypothetical protein